MMIFKKPSREEIDGINKLQRQRFNELFLKFEPPLPEKVPGRLEKIVAFGKIEKEDVVLDVGAGTGILIPTIQKYAPSAIYACDLSENMLGQLKKNYPDVETFRTDIKDLTLPDSIVDVVFINACYPNIADKTAGFKNIARIMKPGGRMVISHPLGKGFVEKIRRIAPYPLDDFPEKKDAENLFRSLGFSIRTFIDEPELYILAAVKSEPKLV
ncbi:MAG: methyltransferase domain-containing protein [Desulfobacterales bacterium]